MLYISCAEITELALRYMSELTFYSTPTATVDSVLSNCREMREHDGGAVGRCGVHLSVDTSGINLQTQTSNQNIS